MTESDSTRRFVHFQRLWLTVVAMAALGMLAFLLFTLHEANARQDERIRFRLAFCQEIEKVKSELRSDAEEDYRNLDRTLEVLGIARTAEIERIARQNYETTVRRFQLIDCEEFARGKALNIEGG